MATLKLKHIILYFFTFILLYYADFPGGALISIVAWLQLCILLWKKEYNGKNQMLVFIYFLTLIPLFIFLGSSSIFITIYFKEGAFLFMFMALAITIILTILTVLTSIFGAQYFEPNSNILAIYKNLFKYFRLNQRLVMLASIFLLAIILLPLPLRQDFKISMTLILIHLYLNRKQLQDLIA